MREVDTAKSAFFCYQKTDTDEGGAPIWFISQWVLALAGPIWDVS